MTEETEKEVKNQPFLKIKDWPLVVTIWKNKNDKGETFYNTNLARLYKDGDKWKESTSLNSSDLLKASNLLMLAYNNILSDQYDDFMVLEGEKNL